MTSIVVGNGTGLFDSSLTQAQGYGSAGSGKIGQGGDLATVNAANGNLILQSQDEFISAIGLDDALVRTYNSQGQVDGDNNDGWRLSVYRSLTLGTNPITNHGIILRTSGDGHVATFTYNATTGVWYSSEGDGARDTLSYSSTTGQWQYTQGGTGVSETYDTGGKLLSVQDSAGNVTSYTYTGSLITLIQDSSGQKVYLDYSGNNLTDIRVVGLTPGATSTASTQTITRVRYSYDVQNRLASVSVDLSPEDNSVSDGKVFTTSYQYDGTSTRVTKISESDGSSLAITYIKVGTDYRVWTLKDGLGRVTQFHYDSAARRTDVTDALGNVTQYSYDTQNRLTRVDQPAVNGAGASVQYVYDADGNVSQVTDGENRIVKYTYSADGHDNLIQIKDQLGNTVTRTYDANDRLLTTTNYLTPAPANFAAGNPAGAQTTHYVYDDSQHLSFAPSFSVTPEGRVTQYLYDAHGEQTAVIHYLSAVYSGSTYANSDLLAWIASQTSLDSQFRTKTQRTDSAYDLSGQIKTVTSYATINADGSGNATGKSLRQYVYDIYGRLLISVDPRGSSTTAGQLYVSSFIYDGLNRTIQFTDAGQRVTLTQYDDANKKITTTAASGLVSTNVYNAEGDTLSITQTHGTTTVGKSSYAYDAGRELRIVTDATNAHTYYLYDERGRRVGSVTPEGELTETVYNDADQVIRITHYANRLSASQLSQLIDAGGNPTAVDLLTLRGGTRNDVAAALDLDATDNPIPGFGYRTTYTNAGATVAAVNSSLKLSDADDATLASARVVLVNRPDTSNEILAVNTGGTAIAWSYDASTGVLSLTGAGSVADYQQVLRTLSYRNTMTFATSGERLIDITVNDGTLDSDIATAVVAVTVNHPPVAGNDSYAGIEDQALPIGASVLANDSDPDGNPLTAQLVSGATHGVVVLNANGTFTYTPNPNYNSVIDGPDSFTYRVSDGSLLSNVATVTLNIAAVADAPVAVSDTYNVAEDTTLNMAAVGVLTNDVDVDGKPLTAQLVAGPTHGTLTLNPDGSFTYDPTDNFNGVDTFTYKVTDGALTSNIATVTLNVSAVNDAPVASNVSYTLNEDQPLTQLLGYTDVDSSTLTVQIVTAPLHGTVRVNAGGTFTYTPAANYNGTDSFTYKVSDGVSTSAVATVALTITAVNDPPVAINDSYSATEDTPLTVAAAGVLTNDSDPDNSALTAVLVSGAAHGTVTLNANGSFTYTPVAGFNGTDSFTYRASDGSLSSNIATVTLNIGAVNDEPLAGNDSYTVTEDQPLTIAAVGVLANDSDPDGQAITAQLVAGPVHGTLVLNANGSFTYTPIANYYGTDSFTYKVSDGSLFSNVATVVLTVAGVADAPVAGNDSYTATEDQILTISAGSGLLGNDADADGNTLTAQLVNGPAHGTLTFNATGAFTYKPNADYNGTDTFSYRTVDSTGLVSNVATVTLNVVAVNDAPLAGNDSYSLNEDTPLTVAANGVLANDTDADIGQTLSAVLVTGAAHGTVVLNANGSFSYTPNANYNGTDSFKYRVTDGSLSSGIATVTLNIAAVNDAPVARNDSYGLVEGQAFNIQGPGILANDSDADGNNLTAQLVTGASNGTVTINSDGSFIYTPNAHFNGTDSFTYKVSDGTLSSNIATVVLNVAAVNDAPVAVNNSYALIQNQVLTVSPSASVTLNDTDTEAQALTAQLVTGAAHGTVSLNANGAFTYTPTTNYTGTDSFTYKVSDGSLTSNLASVTLTVAAVGTTPGNESYAALEDQILTIPAASGVLANDANPALTAQLATSPAHGTLTLNPDGSFVYTPAAGFSGADSFTYKTVNGGTLSSPFTATLNIAAANDAPTAGNDSYSGTEDTVLTVAAAGVLANDADADGSPLTAQLISGAAHGTVKLNANGSFSYTPNAGFSGTDSFTYRASDGALGSNLATVTLTVAAVNDVPVANNDGYNATEDTALPGTGVLANDTDADGNPLTAQLVTGPVHGTLTLNANGSFSYTPAANFSGQDSFTYKASDGTLISNVATVVINVAAANDAPVAGNDVYGATEDQVLSVTGLGVLANDPDADGQTLTVQLVTGPAHGTLALNANGTFTYTPAANYNGTDTFAYKLSDGTLSSNVATVTLNIAALNDAPVAVGESYAATEDTLLSVAAAAGVLLNDTDTDGTALTAQLVGGAAHGTVVLNANGSFTYTSNPNYNGSDSFTYRVSDGSFVSNLATVTLSVAAVNDAPVTSNDRYSTNEDTALTVAAAGVLANDADVDNPNSALTVQLVAGPAHGTLTLSANGSFSYTPDADYNGVDTFTYKLSDGTLTSNVASVVLAVNAVNDAPVATGESVLAYEDIPLTGALSYSDLDSSTLTPQLVTGPAHGSVTISANGTFTYTPNPNYNGTDSFTYRVYDGSAYSNVATVTLTITAVNDAPVAVNNSYTATEDTPLTVAVASGVLVNDSDVDSTTLTAQVVNGPTHGTLVLNTNGSFTYTPGANYNGADSFTYRVYDGSAYSNIATVTLSTAAVNDPPTAGNISYGTNEDTALTATTTNSILSKNPNADGDTLTVQLVAGSGPSHGTLTLNANGTFTYTPTLNYNGGDQFSYNIKDSTGLVSGNAIVTLSVAPVNDAPVAVNDAYSATEDQTYALTTGPGVLLNDTDVDGNPLTAVLVSGPSHGAVTLNANGTFSYTPAANYNGTDSFTYKVSDGSLTSNTATVTFTIVPANDAPIAANGSFNGTEDMPLTVMPTYSDIDSTALTPQLVTGPAHGTVTLNTTNQNGVTYTHGFTYTPAPNYNGADSFTYRINDGSATSNLSNTATVSLSLAAVNDAPVAPSASYTLNEDTPLTKALGYSDVDGPALTVQITSGTAHGSVSLSGGNFIYTPALNYNGTDSFTYTVSDGSYTSTGTISLTINAINDAPVAANDGYSLNEDTTLTVITGPGGGQPSVLWNDTDVEGQALTAQVVNGPAHGTLTLTTDGSFAYKPNANYNGIDSFTYRASDGSAYSNIATVTLNITAVNDAPVASNDYWSLNEDTPLNGNVLANDYDVDGNPLTPSVVTNPSHGTLQFNGDGSFTYTPFANYNGADSFTYQINDGNGASSSATVFLTIAAVNDAPVAIGHQYASYAPSISDDAPGVLEGAIDVDGDSLTVRLVSGPGPYGGTVTLNADGSFQFHFPAALVPPDRESFSYVIDDGHGGVSNTASVLLKYDVKPGQMPQVVQPGGTQLLAMHTSTQTSASSGVQTLAVTQPSGLIAVSSDDRSTYYYYDAAGRVSYQVDGAGSVTGFNYDGANRKIKQTQYFNQVSVSALPSSGNASDLVAANLLVPNGADRSTRYFYDDDGLLSGVLDADGDLSETVYDGASEATRSFDYATPVTDTTLLTSGTLDQLRTKVTTVSDPSHVAGDHLASVFYDAEGRVTGQLDAQGFLSAEVYDSAGNLKQQTGYAKAVSYDGTQTLASLVAAATLAGHDQIQKWDYDALNRVTAQTDQQNTVTQYTYDPLSGFLTSSVAAFGTADARTTNYKYDDLGRVINRLDGEGSAALAAGSTTAWNADSAVGTYGNQSVYDLAGRKIKTIDADGHATFYYYDSDSRLRYTVNAAGEVTETQYDAFGDVGASIQYAARISLSGLTGGLLSSNTAFVSTVSASTFTGNALNRTARYSYDDDRGLLTQTVDGRNFITNRNYDAFGELYTQNTDVGAAPGAATRTDVYSYNKRGLLTQTVQDSGSGTLNLTSKVLKYDAFGRALQTQDAKGNITYSSYNDTLGHTVTVTDPLGKSATTTYDAFSRVLSQTDRSGVTTSYSYTDSTQTLTTTTPEGIVLTTVRNRYGQTIKLVNGVGVATLYTYDLDGNLETTTVDPIVTAGDSHLNLVTSNTYDDADLLGSTVDANGVTTAYGYDAVNRVLTRTVDPTTVNPAGLNLLTKYAYDAFGAAYQVTDPTGVITETVFDNRGETTAVIVDTAATGLRLMTLYSYDALGNTLTVTEGNKAAGSSGAWTYAAAPNTTLKSTQYFYDNAGRLKTQLVDGGTGTNPATGQLYLNLKTQYFYDADNNLVRTIDANTQTWRYVYNADNRLAYRIDPLGDVTETRYDNEGRVSRMIQYATPLGTTALGTLTDASTPAAVVPVSSANDRSSWQVYDGNGRLTYSIDALGEVTGYTYDNANRLVDTTQSANRISTASLPDIATPLLITSLLGAVNGSFSDDFSDGSLSPYALSGGTGIQETGGHLVITSQSATTAPNTTYTQALGTRSYNIVQMPVVFSAEFTPTGTSGQFYFGANGSAGAAVASQLAHFTNGGQIYAYNYYNGSASETLLGTYAANTTYVVELAVTAEGSILYVYKKGQSRANGYSFAFNVAWTRAQTRIQANRANDEVAYLDNLAELLGSSADQHTRTVYDAAGRAVYQIDTLGDLVQHSYDADGNLVQTRAFATRLASSVSLSKAALDTQVATAGYADAANDRSTHYVYDAANRLAYSVDALGDLVQNSYDANGHLIQTRAYAKPLSGAITYTKSWLDGQLAALVDNTSDRVTRYVYDSAGRQAYVLQTMSSSGATDQIYLTAAFYNGLGQATDTYRYAKAMALSVAAPRMGDISTLLGNSANLDAANDQHIHNTYDAAGRLLSSTDAENGTEHYTYDGLGNKKTYVNKLGYTWTYVYDAAGRMTEEDTPPVSVYAVGTAPGAPAGGATSSSLALVTKMVYDAFGNVVEHIENASAADKTQSRVTSYRYDVLGRQVRTINADTYTDAASVTYGSKVGVYAAGSDATNGYGSSLTPGSPTSLATRSGFENSQALTADTLYDAQGNAIVGRDAAGNYSYKVYDSLGRVAYEIDTGRYVTQYQYNSFGDQSVLIRYAVAINPADATTGGTSTLTSLETALNTALANPGSLAALNAASAAQVKAAALAKAFVANTSNSRSLTTTYDQLDRKKTVAQPAVDYFAPTLTVGTNYIGTASPTTAYSYDAFGDLVTQTALSYPQSVTTTFGYDRLARQTDLVDLGGYYTNNTYDAFNRVIQSWQYAKPVTTAPTALANGMWSFTKPAATAPAANDPLGYDRITQYAYDRLDRQIRVTKVNTTYSYLDPSAASGVTTVTGNTVTSSAYDAIGNLIASTGADGNVTRSYYDALGRLIATGGPTTATANATARTISLQYQVISQKGWQSGSNVVSVNWSSLQTWSGAGLQVVLTYNGYDTTTGAAFSNRTQTVALGMGAAGNTFNWSTDTLGSVVSVVVQVNTGTVAAPNWKTAYTSAAPTKWIEVGNIPASATVVQFQYRPHNSTTAWTTVTMGPGPIAGIWLAGVPAGLGTGDYDYHVSATDQSGNPISLAAPDGRATVTRSGDGSVAMLSDGSAPSLTTMGYDALGDLVMQKRLANGATSLSATSYVAGAADAINDQVSYQRYDILGHVLESVDALGHSEFHSYDQFGHELRTWRAQTDVLGTAVQQTTLYTYDALGRQTGTIAVRRSPDQANSVYTLDKTQALYNAYGEQIASGADLSHVIDSSGKATLSGASSFAAIGATYADYDNAGRLWQTNSGDGVDKVERYDLLGHHTAEILIPSATASTVNATPTERRLNGVADLSGITGAIETDTVYDALGHAIEQRQPSFVQNGTTVAPKVDQTFDRWGNVLSVTDPRVAAWGNRYRYNDQNQVISSDRLEVDTAVDEHGGTIANVAASQYFYDARGNLIETLTPDGATGLATVRHQRLYDAAGELVDEVDSLGANIVHAYDRLNRQIQQVDADGHVTTYAYDRLDQLIEQDQLGFANNANPIYQYHYDESGNRISSTDGIAADLTRDRYDTRGNLITELTPLTTVGNANLGSIYKTSYTYDALGHKIKTTDGDNNTQTWAIDAFGRQTAHTDLGGMVTTDTYDSLGRLLHETSAQATLTNDGSDLSGWLWTSSNSANEVGGGQLNGSNSFTEAMVQPDYGSPSAGPDGLAAGKPAILLHVSQGSYSQISRSLGLRSSTTFSVSADLLLDQASGSGPQQAAIYFGSSGRTGPKLELNSGNQQGVLKYTDGNGGTISKAYSYTRGDWLRVVVSGTRNADGTYQTTFSLIDLSTGGNTILTFSAGAKFAGDEVAFSAENGGEDNGNAVVVDNIDIKGGVNAGEDQTYAYYANGELSTLTDNANQTVTTYQYDAAGHHTLEKFASSGGTVYQNASLAYDSQGRLISDTDSGRSNGSGATITNRYDAAGNRREITSSFTAGSTGGTSGTTDHWYTYDDENRILIAEGKKDASNNIVLDSSDTNSASLAYDAAGNRRNETQYQNGNLTYLSYNYDPANRLTATYTSSVAGQLGAQTSGRSYDSAGRVLSYFEKFSQTGYYQPGAQDAYVYNLNGELLEQRHSENGTLQYAVGYAANSGTTYSKDAASPVATSAGWYDGAGTLSHYEYVATTDNVRVSYDYRYRKADGYQESLIIGKETSNDASNGHEGVTTQSYDSNNHLIKLIDQYNDTPTRKYVVNGQGQTVLRNDSNGKSQSTFWGNNIEVGSGGGISANQFDFNYTPISAQYPSTVPAQYVLQSGDTLESIALLSYGDASLWYLIADANGVSSDADLQNLSIGTALTIPNVVSNVHNNADTFKPYDPRSVIGDTTPTIQPPPPPQHACEELATIIGAVVRAVVTIVSSFIPYVGPYIAPALGAAAGDVAKQDVELIADGKFNFGKYFEYAWIDPLLLASKQAGGSNFSVHEVELAAGSAEAGSLGSMIGGPLLGNVAGQYFNMTNNAQHGFDWGSLAGTVVSSALTGGSSYDPVANFVGGVGAAYTQKWITHGRHQERVDFAGIAANAYADAAISLFSYKGDDSGSGGEGFSLNGFNFNWGGTNGFSFNYSGDYGFGLLGQWTADAFGNEQGNSVVGAVGTAPGEMQAASDTQWGGANDPTAGGDVDSTPYQAQPGYRVGIGNSDGSIGYGTVSPDGYGYTDAADQGAPIVGRTSSQGKTTGMIFMRADGTEEVAPYNNVPPDTAAPTDTPSDANQAAAMASTGTSTGENAAAAIQQVGALNTKQSDSGSGFVDLVGIFSRNFSDSFFNTTDSYGTHLGDQAFTLKSEGFYATDIGKSLQSIGDFLSVDIDSALNGGVGSTKTAGGVRATGDFLNYLFTQSDNLQNAQDFVGDKLTSLSDWSNNTTPDQKAALAGQVGGKLVVDLGVAEAGGELTQAARSVELGGDAGKLEETAADVAKVGERAKYLDDLKALRNEINRRAQAAVQQVRDDIANGATVKNPGSLAHDYLARDILSLQDELDAAGSSYRVAAEQFRDLKTGRIVQENLPSAIRPAGSIGLDVVAYDNGTLVEGLDLKTYQNVPHGFSRSQLADLSRVFKIPQSNITQIFIKR